MEITPRTHDDCIPALEGSKTTVTSNDKVFIKEMWKHPIPTHYEVKLLMDLMKDEDPHKIAYAIIIVTGARPVEIVRIQWNKFVYDKEEDSFTTLYHETYKATNRKSKIGRHIYFKQVCKEISPKSAWLDELLKNYREKTPAHRNNKLFGFSEGDSLNKDFSKLRKKIKKGSLPPEYECFTDQNVKQIKGVASQTRYRISLYSLRRFAITFMYWSKAPAGFDQDIISLSKYVGHSNPKTTYEHYVFPKEAIGLTKAMIEERITIDQFINLSGAPQTQLTEWVEKTKYEFIAPGQRTITEFS